MHMSGVFKPKCVKQRSICSACLLSRVFTNGGAGGRSQAGAFFIIDSTLIGARAGYQITNSVAF